MCTKQEILLSPMRNFKSAEQLHWKDFLKEELE